MSQATSTSSRGRAFTDVAARGARARETLTMRACEVYRLFMGRAGPKVGEPTLLDPIDQAVIVKKTPHTALQRLPISAHHRGGSRGGVGVVEHREVAIRAWHGLVDEQRLNIGLHGALTSVIIHDVLHRVAIKQRAPWHAQST